MNHLLTLTSLKNQYFGMRHGQSLANCEGLIVSTPENGVPGYGLSDEGKLQVDKSTTGKSGEINSSIQIISSDFKRAHESSKIAHKKFDSTHALLLDSRLRERNFGDYELTADVNYQKAWSSDASDSSHTIDNVESADSVMARATELVVSLEEKYNGCSFLLVAHGDTLQILQTAFKKYPASKQRELTHLETAEIRELVLAA